MELGTSQRQYSQGGVSALLVLFIACFSGSLARADALRVVRFGIPAGDAQTTLLQFLSQSNIEMLYSSDDVRGITTHALSGMLTVPEALRRMLEGTGLEISFESDYTFASLRPARKIRIGPETPSGLAATTNTRELLGGRPDIPGQALAEEPKLEEVVVTGTLIHGVLDIMSPLQFVTRRDMKRTSYATVQDALRVLTLTSGGGPAENTTGLSNAGNFGRGVSANLRGLGAGATLVLINGYRQPFSGVQGDFVDLSNIPWSAVERIEVLPDGASALYGSDAIAGVVNVIMRKDLTGGETWARLGAAPGGAEEKLVAQLFGTKWSSGRAMLSYQYTERAALAAAARTYAANADKRALGGTDHRSINSSPGNILDPLTLQPAYGLPPGSGLQLTTADLLPGNANLQNRYATFQLLPDRRMHSVYFDGSQNLGERMELFTQGRYSKREVEQQSYAADRVLAVPSANPFAVNPFAGSPYVLVGYSFLDTLGPIRGRADTQTYDAVVGLRADVGDTWRLTLSGSYGRERLSSVTSNLPDQSALNSALISTDPMTAFNPFGDSNSPAVIDTIRTTQLDVASSSIRSTTAVADGTVIMLPSGAAKLAVGAESRQELLGNAVGKGMPYGRDVRSAFAELSVPIIGEKDDPRAVPRLELSLAGRFEDYSDFGSAWNPKVGLRWAPTTTFKVRTSWGTAFKAPKLTDMYDSSHNVATLAAFRDPRSETGSSIVLAVLGNNPHLKQETATTWTAGIDMALERMPISTLSLTYYSINYTDRILHPASESPADILLRESQWTPVITRDPSASQVEAVCGLPYLSGPVDQCKAAPVAAIIDFGPRNLAATRVRGIDVKLDRPIETSHGYFRFGLTGAYVLSFDQAVSSTSPTVDLVDTVGNPLALRLRGTAEWYQHGWDAPGFGVNATVAHAGAYRDSEGGASKSVAGLTTLDLRLSYRAPQRDGPLADIELNLNATNVFNRSPPFVDREEGYDALNSLPYGRVVSFSVQKKW